MKWCQVEQSGPLPEARSSHSLTVIATKAYLFGGEHVPRAAIDSQIHCFDLEASLWLPLQVSGCPPSPRVAHGAAHVGKILYIFGGRSGVEMGEGSTNDLYSFDTLTNTWTKIQATGPVPEPRSFHAMAAVATKLYVFGGCGQHGRLSDLHCYDTETGTWERLPDSPDIQGRGGAGLAATASGNALYVIAGFAGKEMSDVHRFDLLRNMWDCPNCIGHTTSDIPARSVFGVSAHLCTACAHGNHVVLFGGEVDPSSAGHAAGKFSSDVFCFDAEGHCVEGWHRLEAAGDPPIARGWFAASNTADGLLIHGGNSETNERLGDMYHLLLHEES
ncbi:hypothetical protein WJX72_005521 [[Myrmecia] bisecta]|uniref:Nitrile-specifier protein 5 n=1 Tax=[Myrmecia] bisecta TaxID=41462 RepID=A0AAW1P5W1_9CHLO